MEITYQISEKDYLDAQRLAIKNSPVLLLRLSRVVLPCFGLFLLVFLIHTVSQQGFSSKMLPGLIFPFWFMALPLLNRQKQKKLYAQSTNIHGQISLQVNDDELHIQSPTSSTRLRWAHFSNFFEDQRSFILYQSPQIFIMIPKRTVTAEQTATLREYFQRHIARSG